MYLEHINLVVADIHLVQYLTDITTERNFNQDKARKESV